MTQNKVLNTPLQATTPLAPEVLNCPIEFNRRLRAEAPVYQCPHTGIVFVSDYPTICAVARNHQVFSNRFAQAMSKPTDEHSPVSQIRQTGYPTVDTMLTQDPPKHRRYRSLVNQAFTARRVASLEPHIAVICHELIDDFIDAGECEFVSAFSKRLPMTVIAEQLGVPLADYDLFTTWSDAFVAQLSGLASEDEEVAAAKQIVEFQNYFAARLEERRAAPKDDILSAIVHASIDGEQPLDIAEMLSILQQLLVAGNETTTHAISEGVLLLIRHPQQMDKLRKQPQLLPGLVEEVLRLSTPTANMWRVAAEDTRLGEIDIPAGTMLQLRFSSANRDESVFADADGFDIERDNASSNIAFGHGVHMCIGASLARKELAVAFATLLERLQSIELDCPEEELVYPANVLLRGVATLPVRFTSRTK